MNLIEKWKKEEQKSFVGWDFSYLSNRWEEEYLPWDYLSIVKKYLSKDLRLLDMGTGGGEFLLTLNHPFSLTSVTEGWEPNVNLCKDKLSPLGIVVKQVYDDDLLPFKENTFDIIINRHESYNVNEVKRVLKPNGIFITQQVGSKNNVFLSKFLIDDFKPMYPKLNLTNSVSELIDSSFKILYKNEYFPYSRFYDIGAIVYYAKIISWEFPNFSVKNCFDKLMELHKELETKPYIESFEHRFIIVAKIMK